MEPEQDEVLTTDEAAALLKVSTKTLLKEARAGLLPGQKVGRSWRFVRRDLLASLTGRLQETG
jgi:excisionase family DNA binding protein